MERTESCNGVRLLEGAEQLGVGGCAYEFVEVDGKVISTSKVAHVATAGGKVTNPKRVKAQAQQVVGVGKVKKLGAKQVNPKTGTVKKHAKLRYESTNTKVAKVSKSGKVKGVAAGKCTVWVYAQNGAAKKITVTVN